MLCVLKNLNHQKWFRTHNSKGFILKTWNNWNYVHTKLVPNYHKCQTLTITIIITNIIANMFMDEFYSWTFIIIHNGWNSSTTNL
jgi:hypothetical protein